MDNAQAGLFGTLPGLTIARNAMIEKVREVEKACGLPDSLRDMVPPRKGRPPNAGKSNVLGMLNGNGDAKRRGRPVGSKNKVQAATA